MNALRTLVCGLAAVATAHGAWQDELSPTTPGRHPALRPLRAHYEFGWGAFDAAEGDMAFGQTKTGELRLDVRVKTTGFVRTLFRLDATHAAIAHAATLRPVRLEQTEIYDGESLRTTVAFDAKGVTRLRVATPPDRTAPRSKRFKNARAFDLHTALRWLRSQRLQAGDTHRLIVYPAAAPYLAEVRVAGREKVKIAGRARDAVKLELKLRRIDAKTMKAEAYGKFRTGSAWLSDDADRLLLRAEAELFIGSVWAELRRVESR